MSPLPPSAGRQLWIMGGIAGISLYAVDGVLDFPEKQVGSLSLAIGIACLVIALLLHVFRHHASSVNWIGATGISVATSAVIYIDARSWPPELQMVSLAISSPWMIVAYVTTMLICPLRTALFVCLPTLFLSISRALIIMQQPSAFGNAELVQTGLHMILCEIVAIVILCGLTVIRTDIETRADQARRLSLEAATDPLTGLANRASMDASLRLQLAPVASTTAPPLGLVMLDLDHFKSINDTHGHLVGDEVIRRTASILQRESRDVDFVCRWGGEEFVCLVQGAGLDEAIGLARRLKECMAQAAWPPGLQVTASFGVTALERNDSPDTLLSRADSALYASKRSGRNRIHVRSGAHSAPVPA